MKMRQFSTCGCFPALLQFSTLVRVCFPALFVLVSFWFTVCLNFPVFPLLVPHPKEDREVISLSVDREFPEQAYLAGYLREDDTVLSLGGNVGATCVFIDKFLKNANPVGSASSSNAQSSITPVGSSTTATVGNNNAQSSITALGSTSTMGSSTTVEDSSSISRGGSILRGGVTRDYETDRWSSVRQKISNSNYHVSERHLCIEPNPNTWPILEANRFFSAASFQIENRIIARPATGKVTFESAGIMSKISPSTDDKKLRKLNQTNSNSRILKTNSRILKTNSRIFEVDSFDPDLSGFSVLISDCEGCFCAVLKTFPEITRDARLIINERDAKCDYDFDLFLENKNFQRVGGSLSINASPRHDIYLKQDHSTNFKQDYKDDSTTAVKQDSTDTSTASSLDTKKQSASLLNMVGSNNIGNKSFSIWDFLFFRNMLSHFLILADIWRRKMNGMVASLVTSVSSDSQLLASVTAPVTLWHAGILIIFFGLASLFFGLAVLLTILRMCCLRKRFTYAKVPEEAAEISAEIISAEINPKNKV